MKSLEAGIDPDTGRIIQRTSAGCKSGPRPAAPLPLTSPARLPRLAGMQKPLTFTLHTAGHTQEVLVSQEEMDSIHAPLLARMEGLAQTKGGRAIVFLAGPPGCGKSTLAALWEELSRQRRGAPVQALPLDGFHYPNAVLDARTVSREGQEIRLRLLKGSPESYDRESLASRLRELHEGRTPAWPVYDRTIHEPVPSGITVAREGVLVVEGNYLLLDEPGWRELAAFKDLGIFLDCGEEDARRGILARHQRGGRSPQDAASHYAFNDEPNRARILRARHGVDAALGYGPGRLLRLV
jgi:putative kinase